MSRRRSQTIAAPSGMDSTSDPTVTSPDKARLLGNYQVDRAGLIHATTQLVNILQSPLPSPIDGIGYYYAVPLINVSLANTYSDVILAAIDGRLYQIFPSSDPLNTFASPQFFVPGGNTGYVTLGRAFFTGKRVRFLSLSDESIIVQEGGILPLRFYSTLTYGTGFYRAGIQPPVSTGASANLVLSAAGAGGITGTFTYKLTFADERGRESSPCAAVSFAIAAKLGVVATVNLLYAAGVNTGHSLNTAYLYRSTLGAPSVFYRIASHAIPNNINSFVFAVGDYTYDVAVAYDDAPDSAITSGQLCPSPGENDPPNPASVGIVWKNRVVLNDVTNSNTVQISNTNSTTQYTSIPTTPVTLTDGERTTIGSDQGNVITGFAEFGNYLAIFKRRNIYYLAGDNIGDFIIRPLYDKGCIAPDSIARCDNSVLFMSDDGIYATSYAGGDTLTKISKEIEEVLYHAASPFVDASAISAMDRQNSFAVYYDRQYRLTVGRYVFVYDFDRQSWYTEFYGNGGFSAHDGIPGMNVIAGVGWTVNNGQGDAGLYGAAVQRVAPVPPSCSVTLSTNSMTLGATATFGLVTVTAANSAPIGYYADSTWIHVNGPAQGSGVAIITVDANTGGVRTGNAFICGNVVGVTQFSGISGGCSMVSMTPSSFTSTTAAGSVVSTRYVEANDAAISIASDSSWITYGAPVNDGFRTGTIAITIAANTSCSSRSGNVTVCDQTVSISQLAATLTTDSALGLGFTVTGTPDQTITVTNTPAVTIWNVTVSDGWIVIDTSTGVGNGTMTVHCTDNTGGAARAGSISICGAVVPIAQQGL